ncbi:MAG: UPF0175 family protein [Anaerolineales bacterium]|nr:UPF0175 family protein [Anaerolineales bacterium]
MSLSDVSNKQATINYPAEIPEHLELADDEFVSEILLLAAAKWFELGRLTSTQAAQLAGLSRLAFIRRLEQIAAPGLDLQDEIIDAEIDAVEDLAG